MPTKQENSIRKAAIFVRGLDKASAETLYSRMSAVEADQLRQAVRNLGTFHKEEQSSVVDELRRGQEEQQAERSSLYDDREGVALEIGSEAIHAPLTKTVKKALDLPDDPNEWFSCIGQAEPAAVASYLSSEQPRTIGLVLSYIPPDLAAKVLAEFSEDQQAKILLQLASLGEADPTSVRVIATGLSSWIKRQQQDQLVRASRLSSVQAILSAVPDSNRGSIVERLQEEEPTLELVPPATKTVDIAELKEEVQAQPANRQPQAPVALPAKPRKPRSQLSYQRLHNADAETLTMALATLPNRRAMLALVEADDKLVGKIKSKMPRRLTKSFDARLMKFAPASLLEIDEAKNDFAMAVEKILTLRKRSTRKAS